MLTWIIETTRASLKLVALLLIITIECVVIVLVRLLAGNQGAATARLWFNKLILFALGFKHNSHGQWVKGEAAMVCSNHPSYIDIFMIFFPSPMSTISAREFKYFPFIGQLGMALKTIWIDRKRPVNMRKMIVSRYTEGCSIFICPEGRTSGSHSLHPIFPGMFKTAMAHQIPIVFYNLRYSSEDIPYFHDLKKGFIPHLLAHIWIILKRKRSEITTHIGKPHMVTNVTESMQAYYDYHEQYLKDCPGFEIVPPATDSTSVTG
ncbi:MAG: lysophospholipid acyltransferase family protein [Schleiferiaceae bacterium]|nr:lysophospholipid acyltransferase family protein [Schleiferiaceae bacterium]